MVFYKLPSAQQILRQCGITTTIINGASDVSSTIINISELPMTTIRQQRYTSSVISICSVMIRETLILESHEPGLDLDVALKFGGVNMKSARAFRRSACTGRSSDAWKTQSRHMTNAVEAFEI